MFKMSLSAYGYNTDPACILSAVSWMADAVGQLERFNDDVVVHFQQNRIDLAPRSFVSNIYVSIFI